MTLAQELAKPEYTGLTDQAAADAINAATVPEVVSRQIGIGTVLDSLGPTEGAALLDALDALRSQVSAVKWAWVLLERGELDVGLASTRGQIDALTGVGKPFTLAQADTIKALAVRAVPLWQTLGFNRPVDHGDIKTARAQ